MLLSPSLPADLRPATPEPAVNPRRAPARLGQRVPEHMFGSRAALFFLWGDAAPTRTVPGEARTVKAALPEPAVSGSIRAHFGRGLSARTLAAAEPAPRRPSLLARLFDDTFLFN